MDEEALTFNGKGGTYIKVSLLNKSPKGFYKNDIIKLEFNSKTINQGLLLTPKEALVISTGLMNALLINKKGLLE